MPTDANDTEQVCDGGAKTMINSIEILRDGASEEGQAKCTAICVGQSRKAVATTQADQTRSERCKLEPRVQGRRWRALCGSLGRI